MVDVLALVHGKGKRVERAKAKGGKCSPTLELERMGTEKRKRTDTSSLVLSINVIHTSVLESVSV